MFSYIRDLIRSITKNLDNYDEKYMQVKFNSDSELPLSETIVIPNMAIVARVVFEENNKYYLQYFLEECLYKISK